MKKKFLILFLFLTMHIHAATLTDVQGRRIEADILAVNAQSVSIRRIADGKKFDIPLVKLCLAGREKLSAMIVRRGAVSLSLGFNRQLIGVEQKAAREDQGIKVVPDMFYGVLPERLVARMKEMEVNLLVLPISTKDQASTVAYLRGLKNAGAGSFLSVVISSRRWSLDRAIQRERWATEIAATYNACQAGGVADLIKGCRFDENDPLKGNALTAAQWTEHFENIVDAMDLLNQKTGDAFKSRTVMIHGEGYGTNFKGIYPAHRESDFEKKMRSRCLNYCFSFKLFLAGGPERGKESSLQEWIDYYKGHCGLAKFSKLKKPILFVGNSGDGLFSGSFRALDTKTEVRDWYCRPSALLKVFQEYGWQHFAFGPIIQPREEKGRTLLNHVDNGKIVPRRVQLQDWSYWKTKVRQ